MEIQYHEIKDLGIAKIWTRSAYRSSDIMCYRHIINNTECIYLSYNAPLEYAFFGFSCYPNLDKKLCEWNDSRTKKEIRMIKECFRSHGVPQSVIPYMGGGACHMLDMIIPKSKENAVKKYFEAQKQGFGDLLVIVFDHEDRISARQKELLSMFDRSEAHAEKLFEVVTDLENAKPSEFSDLLIKDQNMWTVLYLNVQLGLNPPLAPLLPLLTPWEISRKSESEIEALLARKLVTGNAYAAALINLLDWPTCYSKVHFTLENHKEEVTAPKADGSVYSYQEELTRYKKRMEEKYPFLLMTFD